MSLSHWILLSASAVLLSACATAPPQVGGNFSDVSTAQASTGVGIGTRVRWGGVVTAQRSVGTQACIEVASFPVDQLTAKPYAARGTLQQGFMILFTDGKYLANPPPAPRDRGAPARFVACSGDDHGAPLQGHRGDVVTVAGLLQQPIAFEAKMTDCSGAQEIRYSDYSGNVSQFDGNRCTVSLPQLSANAVVVWKEPPTPHYFARPSSGP